MPSPVEVRAASDPNPGSPTNEQNHAMLKDVPLVEAALQTGHIVVSRDEDARVFFQIRELSTITWVNPLAEPEQVLQ